MGFLREDWLHKGFVVVALALIALATAATLLQRRLGRPVRRPAVRTVHASGDRDGLRSRGIGKTRYE